jgi:hypothetical protein
MSATPGEVEPRVRPEQEQFRAIQKQAQRWIYLGSAMAHPKFLQTVGEINPGARTQIEEMSGAFS